MVAPDLEVPRKNGCDQLEKSDQHRIPVCDLGNTCDACFFRLIFIFDYNK